MDMGGGNWPEDDDSAIVSVKLRCGFPQYATKPIHTVGKLAAFEINKNNERKKEWKFSSPASGFRGNAKTKHADCKVLI